MFGRVFFIRALAASGAECYECSQEPTHVGETRYDDGFLGGKGATGAVKGAFDHGEDEALCSIAIHPEAFHRDLEQLLVKPFVDFVFLKSLRKLTFHSA